MMYEKDTDEITIDKLIASGYLQQEDAVNSFLIYIATWIYQLDHDDPLTDDDWILYNG